MKQIKIKTLSQTVSQYCLGTMYFGSKVDLKNSLRLIDIYAEQGGNFLDSANKYASWIEGCHGGESERVIAAWLKGKQRDRYVITSKLGFPYGDVPKGLRAEEIVSECEKSLKRLETDYIDIYFAHKQDEDTPIEESLEAFSRLVQAGKIRAVGASNYYTWRLAEAEWEAESKGLPHYVALQQRYTYLQPVMGADFGSQLILTPEQIDFCARHDQRIMAYSPLLAGLYERENAELPVQYRSEHNAKRMELLHRRAAEWGYTPSQLVLGWMAGTGPMMIPVVTASRPEHLEANLKEIAPEHIALFAEEVDGVDRFTIKYS